MAGRGGAVIFMHKTNAVQLREAGVLLTDLSRPHVIRVLGVLEHAPLAERRRAWSDEATPDPIRDYLDGRLRGEQEAADGEPHHPLVPSFGLTSSGDAWLLLHQTDQPDTVEDDALTFGVSTGARHTFVFRSGVRVQLQYEDEAPMKDAVAEVTDSAGNVQRERASDQGWFIAGTTTEDGAMLRVRLVGCAEGYAPPGC